MNVVKIMRWVLFGFACSAYVCLGTTDVFDSLAKIELYAKQMEEYPAADNIDWEKPDFSTFYKKTDAYRFYKTLRLNPLWTVADFKTLLNDVTRMREYAGYYGRLVTKIEQIPGKRLVIFGELHGAFHSLARDLRALKGLGYIDEKLKIVKQDVLFLFNGNVSSRSAYALETLTVVLRLMWLNPDNVVFVLGSQEDKERWIDYSLKSQLMAVARGFKGKIPLDGDLNKFFNTLPLAFYLVASRTPKAVNVVRISNYGADFKELSEKEFSDFFTRADGTIGNIGEGARKKAPVDINMKAIIRGEQFFKSQYVPSTGLQLSGKEEGATGWTIMSSPTSAYQILFQFYYDAFVILTMYDSLDDWTLSLYNRDVREMDPIKQARVVKLISGSELKQTELQRAEEKVYKERVAYYERKLASLDQSLNAVRVAQLKSELASLEGGAQPVAVAEPLQQIKKEGPQVQVAPKAEAKPVTQTVASGIPMGKDPSSITVGTLIDLSDGVREEGESIVQGIRAVFDKQNEQGGIGGKKLNVVARDMKYSSEYSRIGCEKLLTEDKTGIILVPHSTVGVEGLLEFAKKKSILLLFPAASGARGIRRPDLTTMFFLRASTIQEGYVLVKYVAEKLKAKKFAFFYENDTFGKDTFYGAQQALQELGIKEWVEIPYEPQSLNISDHVALLKRSNIDALGCFGMQAVVKELFSQLGTEWLVNKKLFGSMDLSILSFRKYCERNRLQFVSTSVVPNPELSDVEIVKEYRRAVENAQPSNDMHCLEAFIGADFFVHILKQIGEPITSDKIIAYLEQVKNYKYKGLTFNFNPETRELMNDLWLNKGPGDWELLSSSRTIAASSIPITSAMPVVTPVEPEVAPVIKVAAKAPVSVPKIEQPEIILPAPPVVQKTPANGAEKIISEKPSGQRQCVVGSTMDLSRGVKDLGIAIKASMELALNSQPIEGTTISLIVLDDEYSPEKARENVLTLINKHAVDFLLNPLGTPTFGAFVDLVKSGSVVALFPIPGIAYRRALAEQLKSCVFFRPSYTDEAYVLLRHIIEISGTKKIALFYQDDDFGLASVEGARKAVVSKGVDLLEVAYTRNDVDFKRQVAAVKEANIEYIALLAIPVAARRFIEQLGDEFARKSKFFGISDLGGDFFQKMVQTKGISITRTNVVPDPETSTIALVQLYRDRMKEAGLALGTWSLEAYIATTIFVDALKHIKGAITKESVLEEIEGMRNYSVQGFPVNFDPQTRQLSNTIWIDDGKGPWKELKI